VSHQSENPYDVRVRLTPLREGITTINVEGSSVRIHHLDEEAESAAVCEALKTVIRRVARDEIEAGDGFTVKVVFQRDS